MSKPEVVARLLTWAGPRHEPVPWEGVCARTFLEFPRENPFHGHWKEGEPLIRLTDHEAAMAELQDDCNDAAENEIAITRYAAASDRAADKARIDELLGLLRDIQSGCQRRDIPSEATIAGWADRIDVALSQQGKTANTKVDPK